MIARPTSSQGPASTPQRGATVNRIDPQTIPVTTLLVSLLAMNAFAIVEPILSRLGGNAAYLTLEGFSSFSIVVCVLLLLTAIPVGLTLVVLVLRRCRAQRLAAGVAVGSILLMSVLGMQLIARWWSALSELLTRGVPDFALAIIACAAGAGATWLYFRAAWYRQLLCLAAAGCVLFPVQFWRTPAIYSRLSGERPAAEQIQATNPAPVLLIVFDGLCGMALLDERHEVDRVRYPGFARLADLSTFYRNATTVHPRTDHAVPAILSSCLPEEWQQAVESDYPRSLFRIVHDTRQYEMTLFEPYTRMAPTDLRELEQTRTTISEIRTLLATLSRVFLNVSLPRDLSSLEVTIPKTWFGIVDRPPGARSTARRHVVYGMDASREVQCEHFRDSLTAGDRAGFWFMHVVVPHDPFSILPSGKSTMRVCSIADPIYGTASELWANDDWAVQRAWQRYLLQLQFADRWINQFLNRLDEIGQLEETMIVVTGDHGMAFAPGSSRRAPTAETMPGILSVPLFIKRPGQRAGSVTDRNVETIDILPTIVDELGLPADAAWDGQSLLDDRLSPRPRKMLCGEFPTVIEPDFPQRFEYVDQMIAVFGTGSRNDRLLQLNLEPDLIGRAIESLKIGEPTSLKTRLIMGGSQLDPNFPSYVPCYLHGALLDADDDPHQHRLAIALNGVILATTRTSTDRVCRQQWAALLPEDAYRANDNELRVFELRGEGEGRTLHEVRLEPFPS